MTNFCIKLTKITFILSNYKKNFPNKQFLEFAVIGNLRKRKTNKKFKIQILYGFFISFILNSATTFEPHT